MIGDQQGRCSTTFGGTAGARAADRITSIVENNIVCLQGLMSLPPLLHHTISASTIGAACEPSAGFTIAAAILRIMAPSVNTRLGFVAPRALGAAGRGKRKFFGKSKFSVDIYVSMTYV